MDTEAKTTGSTPPGEPLSAGGDPPPELPDVLPPVTRPSGGFLMQLFFIPLIIVAIIVTVWFSFSWLAHMGSRPEDLVQDLEKMNHASWQQALTLANMLRDPRNQELRENQAVAGRLVEVLERQLEAGGLAKDEIWLRIYLCRALGEFAIPDGVAVLARAAATQRDPAEADVRRAALEAVARLSERVDVTELQNHAALIQALRDAAHERSDQPERQQAEGKLRSTSAFVMGLIGGQPLLDELARLLSDPHPDARYNAATGLARHGDQRAVNSLLQMLDPANPDVVKFEDEQSDHTWKRELVMLNALKASYVLAEQNSTADLSPLQTAIEDLLAADVGRAVNVQAQDVLRVLRQRAATRAEN